MVSHIISILLRIVGRVCKKSHEMKFLALEGKIFVKYNICKIVYYKPALQICVCSLKYIVIPS